MCAITTPPLGPTVKWSAHLRRPPRRQKRQAAWIGARPTLRLQSRKSAASHDARIAPFAQSRPPRIRSLRRRCSPFQLLHPDFRLRRLPRRLLPARSNRPCPRRHRRPCSAVTPPDCSHRPLNAVTAAALAALTTAGETIAAARNTRSERGREEGREGSANELKDSAAERGAVTDAKANFDREASTNIARRRHTRSGGCRCCRRISCSPGDPPLLLLLLCAVALFGCLGSRTEGNPEADPRRPGGGRGCRWMKKWARMRYVTPR